MKKSKRLNNGLFSLINKLPAFYKYDIVKIKKTGTIAVINEVQINRCQDTDINQWGISLTPIEKNKNDYNAWYNILELEFLYNPICFNLPRRKIK